MTIGEIDKKVKVLSKFWILMFIFELCFWTTHNINGFSTSYWIFFVVVFLLSVFNVYLMYSMLKRFIKFENSHEGNSYFKKYTKNLRLSLIFLIILAATWFTWAISGISLLLKIYFIFEYFEFKKNIISTMNPINNEIEDDKSEVINN